MTPLGGIVYLPVYTLCYIINRLHCIVSFGDFCPQVGFVPAFAFVYFILSAADQSIPNPVFLRNCRFDRI